MIPLYNYNSPETALLVPDYPYGRKLRCRIRYWLEFNPKKGFRFCSQTENPKTLQWNAVKHSTYMRFAANMFFDDRGYVQWEGISEYNSAEECVQFIKNFPQSNFELLLPWCMMKLVYTRKCISGEVYMTINGKKQNWTEQDIERFNKDEPSWNKAVELMKGLK